MKTYIKDKKSFLKIYDSELSGLVFWRQNTENPNKVDIQIADKLVRPIIEKLPD